MIAKSLFKKRPVKDWAGNRDIKNRNGVFHLSDETRAFYHEAIKILLDQDIPFLLGGAYAFGHYTGVIRHTKDLDLFVRAADCGLLLDALAGQGFRTEITFRHWIAKVWNDADDLIDIIFSSG